MYTRCPHCQTCFRILARQLALAKGKVRCGQCEKVFDARGHLYEDVPAEDARTTSAAKPRKPAVTMKQSSAPAASPHVSTIPTASGNAARSTPAAAKPATATPAAASIAAKPTAAAPAAASTAAKPAAATPAVASTAPKPAAATPAAASTAPKPAAATPAAASTAPKPAAATPTADKNPADFIDLSIPIEPRPLTNEHNSFMDSLVDEQNTHYNNLDDIGSIKIPGDLDFGNQVIIHHNVDDDDAEDDFDISPYIDIDIDDEEEEQPANTGERTAINSVYAAAEEMMEHDPTEMIELPFDSLPIQALRKTEEENADPAPAEKTAAPARNISSGIQLDILPLETDSRSTPPPAPADTSPRPAEPATAAPVAVTDDDADDELSKQVDNLIEELQTSVGIDFEEEPATVTDDDIDEFDLANIGMDLPEIDDEPAAEEKTETDTAAHREEAPAEQETAEEDPFDFDIDEFAEFNDVPQTDSATLADSQLSPDALKEMPLSMRRGFEAAQRNRSSPLRTTIYSISLVLLLLIIGVQLTIYRNMEIANMSSSLHGLMGALCDVLPCRYIGPVDVSKVQIQNRDVRSHPQADNALLISATFANQAAFRQPYPNLQITLSDLSGNVVAQRRFTPEEYMDKAYDPFGLMPPGAPIIVTLAVLDPGDDAINFEFTFM